MENEQQQEQPDTEAQAAEDLEVGGEEAEGVAGGGIRRISDADAGTQRA
jgi:hypothetical protein